MIQSGEIEDEAHTAFVEGVPRRLAPLGMGVTLSLGEEILYNQLGDSRHFAKRTGADMV